MCIEMCTAMRVVICMDWYIDMGIRMHTFFCRSYSSNSCSGVLFALALMTISSDARCLLMLFALDVLFAFASTYCSSRPSGASFRPPAPSPLIICYSFRCCRHASLPRTSGRRSRPTVSNHDMLLISSENGPFGRAAAREARDNVSRNKNLQPL